MKMRRSGLVKIRGWGNDLKRRRRDLPVRLFRTNAPGSDTTRCGQVMDMQVGLPVEGLNDVLIGVVVAIVAKIGLLTTIHLYDPFYGGFRRIIWSIIGIRIVVAGTLIQISLAINTEVQQLKGNNAYQDLPRYVHNLSLHPEM
jgi:hypothetical protein